jgi:predicted metal-dependent peptidase
MQKQTQPKVLDIRTNAQLSPFVTSLLLNEPFFGYIYRHINAEVTDKIPTAGVMVRESELYMIWNPDFLSSLTKSQVIGLLKHEAYHLIFNHCTGRRLDPHMVFNIAADLAINCGIPEEELPAGGLIPGKLPVDLSTGQPSTTELSKLIKTLPRDESAEFYFTKIMEQPKVMKELQPDPSPGSGDSPSTSPGFDSHEGWGDDDSQDAQLAKGKIEQILKDAISKADRSNSWGTVGAAMRDRLREMVSNEVNWKEILRQFVRASRRGKNTSSWSNLHMSNLHESYGPACPGIKRGVTSNINVYFDHSGSMSNEWIELLFGELRNFATRSEFDCYVFDTEVNEKSKIKYKGRRVPELHGMRLNCGGTDFTAPTKHAALQKHLDAMIILTDGGAAKPPKSKVKRCYVLAPGCKLFFEPDPEDYVVHMKETPAN